jgi:hypothetical protein
VSHCLNQHYTGTMDHWGLEVTVAFAEDREVILFDNAASRALRARFRRWLRAANDVAFIRALGLTKVDVRGFDRRPRRARNDAVNVRSRFVD